VTRLGTQRPESVHRRPELRARLAVSLLYALMGTMLGSWGSRLPDIRHAIATGNTAWGSAISIATLGDVVGLAVTTFVIGRFSTRRLSVLGASLIVLNAPLMASRSTLPALAAGLFVWYFATQLMATPMGAQAIEVQRRYGRPLMSGFTACFSAGVLCGAGLGTAASALRLSPGRQFTIVSSVFAALLLVAARWFPGGEADAGAGAQQRHRIRDRFTPQMRLVAVMALLSGFIASASAQWIAIYMSTVIGVSPALAAATYTAMSAAGLLSLMAGDRMTQTVGRLRFFHVSALTAALGLSLAVAFRVPALAVAGFLVMSIGIAAIGPAIDSIAGTQPGLTAA
jgi:predicted MFS family arabinose efflux permease